MLVLSRKPGEQIVLPGLDVTVTVLGVSGKRVRLRIAAPPEISIQRHEIVSASSKVPGNERGQPSRFDTRRRNRG